ncbi:LytR/AlgR family response regulator transcription factor [Flavobacterium sangjuense]|uniref:Transcriptional regulatory protein YpdB n=1 Tax=Flavobacterium sangjuense TaxID=2518177 RepID=A0A4P7PR43_9FLAO|nr:LytTR family DNA-binding domain-containing protein [Flavobacterium sangjuense]QBZ96590.1 Transcriptional regulatory protein YpdB [Flavobacterium sangjuense]
MNCIIIDDEMMARAVIAQMISLHTRLNILEEFSNAIEAIKYLNRNDVDVVFLDVHMPDFTGFDFIDTIKDPPKIVLITSDKNFAINAFEYDCIVDYLVKPITEDRFEKAMQKLNWRVDTSKNGNTIDADKTSNDKTNEFYINISNRLIKIDIPTITVIKALGDYINIKTDTNSYKVHTSLKKIEDKLPKDLFLKIHRSYLINTKKIIDIEDNSVLIGKDVIPVSRGNKPELMKRLNLL